MEQSEMTAGELRAYKQGKEITTKEQMAVCYLCARGTVRDKQVKFRPGIGSDLAVECGMSPETFRRTVNKMVLVLTDRHEDEEFTHAEVVYPKILEYTSAFEEMSESVVMELAEGSFTDENKEIGVRLHDASIAKTKKYSDNAKKVDEKLKFSLMNLYNALKTGGIAPDRAKVMAINRIAAESKKDKADIQRLWSIIMK